MVGEMGRHSVGLLCGREESIVHEPQKTTSTLNHWDTVEHNLCQYRNS